MYILLGKSDMKRWLLLGGPKCQSLQEKTLLITLLPEAIVLLFIYKSLIGATEQSTHKN